MRDPYWLSELLISAEQRLHALTLEAASLAVGRSDEPGYAECQRIVTLDIQDTRREIGGLDAALGAIE